MGVQRGMKLRKSRPLIGCAVSRHIGLILASVCLASLLLVGPALVNAQDDVSFDASVDQVSSTVGRSVTLRLTLSGFFRVADEPQLPPLESFVVLRS